MQAPKWKDPTHWDKPDREWLFHEHLELGKSLGRIAKELRVDEGTVQRWAKKVDLYADLERPYVVGSGSGRRVYGLTRAWLIQEYVEKDQSCKQIGDTIGTSHNAIVKALQRAGIPLRDREAMNDRHAIRMAGEGNPAWVGGTARSYQFGLLQRSDKPKVCEWCKTTTDLQVHHLDHDVDNGALENLTWLCGPCNRIESWAWKLKKQGRADFSYADNQLVVQFIPMAG